MTIWPGWRLTVRLERRKPRRCRFTQQQGDGLHRCIFDAGHPPHGHSLSRNLTAAPVASPGLLRDRQRP